MARKQVWPSRSPRVCVEKIVLANTSGSLETVIVECNRYKRTGLKNGIFDEKRSSFVCSTTGNADAPDNCERFWRYIKRRSHPADLFKGLEYCVLGLGDTNYDKFCYMGEMIDKRLSVNVPVHAVFII